MKPSALPAAVFPRTISTVNAGVAPSYTVPSDKQIGKAFPIQFHFCSMDNKMWMISLGTAFLWCQCMQRATAAVKYSLRRA